MLTDWLLKEYIPSDTALGSPYIDGLFIDDFWCSNIINGSNACTDPVQGPSEIDKYSQMDMGLSDRDIADITRGYLSNIWKLFRGPYWMQKDTLGLLFLFKTMQMRNQS